MHRVCMHIMEEQCKREGITITINMLNAMSIFAGNCLTTVGQGTPYQAVYGRQPAMLPELQTPDHPQAGDSADGRREARIREIAISSMIQATSMARIARTLSAKSSAALPVYTIPGIWWITISQVDLRMYPTGMVQRLLHRRVSSHAEQV